MPGRRYSILDRNRMGPSLELDASNTQVTTTEICTLDRVIMGDLYAASGEYRYEVYVWSDSLTSLDSLFAFGVASPDTALDVVLGDVATAWTLDPSTGEVRNDSSTLETVASQRERVCLGVKLSLSPSAATCDWYVNGTSVYQADLPTGRVWLPAFNLGASETPADVHFAFNGGQDRFECFPDGTGWSVQGAGVKTLNLAVATEGFMASAAVDEIAANTAFAPAVINSRSMTMKCEPQPWFHRSGGGSGRTPSSVCVMRGNNTRGLFDAVLGADARDAVVKIRSLDAPAGGVGSPAAAVVEMTGYLDDKSSPKLQEAELRFKGALARFDGPLRVRRIAPFYKALAGQIWPVGIGSRRLFMPPVLDQEALLYALGDEVQTNVSLVGDGGAPLDRTANPPQYVPAVGGRAMTLDTAPVKRLAVDCSSIGAQVPAPGVEDILDGDGSFDTWSSGVPVGFSLPTNPPFPPAVLSNGSVTQIAAGSGSALRITSNVPYTPVGVGYYFGYPVLSDNVLLYPGKTYRFTFKLLRTLGGWNGDPAFKYGFAIYSSFRDSPAYWITPYREPLTVPLATTASYTFTYTVPRSETAPLPVILAVIARFGTSTFTLSAMAEIDDLVIEELGEYEEAPLIGTGLQETLNEIFVLRQHESASVFSAEDAQALDEATGYKIGLYYKDTPNVLDMVIETVDNWGGVVYEDADGEIRIGRLTPPEEGDDEPVAEFDQSCIDLSAVSIVDDLAPGLTTNWGFRPNCDPFAPGDFVSDTVTVPVGLRAQYQQECQFYATGSGPLAYLYEPARMRERRVFRHDDPDQGEAEGNRVQGMFKTLRRIVRFPAYMRANKEIGIGPSIAPRNLRYAHKFLLTIPGKADIVRRPIRVIGWERAIGDKDRKVIIKGWF